jgi:predicted phage terminase large subunit-like protein
MTLRRPASGLVPLTDPYDQIALEDFIWAHGRYKYEAEQRRQRAKALDALERGDEVRAECSSLIGFIRHAWDELEPIQELRIGWALEAVAEHLEAVTAGDLTRVLINVPPGMMKSLLTGVFWPAWEWGPKGMPSNRILGAAHGLHLATRDSRKMKTLVESEWYKALWPAVQPSAKWGEAYIENTLRGWRQSVAFSGLTGGRGDRVIIDDPLSTEQAESDADRATAERITLESLPSRLNDAAKSAIVMTMQRLHEKDPAGLLIARELGYAHVMLPMRYEPDRRCITRRRDGSVLFVDPRETAGELLFPELFPEETVVVLEKSLGAYGIAGQLQQRPAPREGALFKTSKIGRAGAVPLNAVKRTRSWDLAGSKPKGSGSGKAVKKSSPDWTAGVRISKDPEGVFYVEHVERVQDTYGGVKTLMRATAQRDARLGHVAVTFPQDPGQAGKGQADDLTRFLAGHAVRCVPITGSKVVRATPFSAQVEAGNVVIVETGDPERDAWIEPFLEELAAFPTGAHDDQVDAAADAFNDVAEVVAGEGLMEWYRRQAEAVRNGTSNQYAEAVSTGPVKVNPETGQPDDGRIALRMPTAGGSFYGLEGDRYRVPQDLIIRVKPCDYEAMLRAGGEDVDPE